MCPNGTYGEGCSKICNCSKEGTCDIETGMCECSPGYTGQTCNELCPAYTWGIKCRNRCDCHGKLCNPVTGVCECEPGYLGDR